MSRVLTCGIPSAIVAEFCPYGIREVSQLNGGQVNSTFRVTDALGEMSILQQMAPSSQPEAAEDFEIVSTHLRSRGWETAQPLVGINQSLTPVDEGGNNWRGYRFIPSDETPPAPTKANFRQFAGLLGKLHADLIDLDYAPKASIPHFHDFPYHRTKLNQRFDELKAPDQILATAVLDYAVEQPDIPGVPQLIHGDPKLTNALFRGGEAFTFIDWDTLMVGSPLLDVADMLRSMVGALRDNDPSTTKDDLVPIALSYYAQAHPETDVSTFVDQVMSATKVVSLGLAVRYLVDTVDSNYFQWDSLRYPDSASHNRFRAARQLANFVTLQSSTTNS